MRLKHQICTFVAILSTLIKVAAGNSPDMDMTFSNLSIKEGLSQSTILSSCQDDKGLMWFATHDGLNRYDGYEFTIYRNSAEDSTSIADNIIRKVHIDSKGRLWIGTDKGLSFYDSFSDSFRNFRTGGKGVTGIAEADGDKLLVAVGGSIKIFNMKSWKWDISAPPCQPETFGARVLYRESDNIWIGTSSEGLFCYSIGSKDIKRISTFKSDKPINSILKRDGYLWIGTEGDGLHCINMNDDEVRTYHHIASDGGSLNSNFVRALAEDTYGRLWIGTFNGLSIMDSTGFINIKSDPLTYGSLSQSSVRSICRDTQGGMWLGTWFGGINYWHPARNRFNHIHMKNRENSLNDNVVNCLEEDSDGSIWIGTNSGGVNHYNPHTDRFTHYRLKSAQEADNLESNDIKAIHIDNDHGEVFFGAHAGGLNIIDKGSGRIRHCQYSSNDRRELNVYAIVKGGRSTLFLGTLDGLKQYDRASGKISDVNEDCNGYPIRRIKIRALLNDSHGTFWIGGEDGLSTCRMADGQLKKYDLLTPDYPLSSVFVQGFYESSTKLIWIATRTGLWCYDYKENCLTKYTSQDGLPSDIIHGIEEDTFGRLWISTDKGLSCFNPFTGIFRNFAISDGLQSNQFNPGSHCRKANGELMFGGIYGISSFDPSKIEDNPYTPRPIISKLEVFNRQIRPGDGSGIISNSIMESERMVLRHHQNSFTLEFCVPNYLAGQHNTFAYKLEGYDKEWYEVMEKRSVSYSNLPHGTYTFKVKAANNDGRWNETPTSLEIKIEPIWYRTNTAIAVFVILSLILLWGLYIFIVERKERENRLELEKQEKIHQENIHQMKMRFFINISHEMRTPLTLIINPLSEMIGKSTDTWMRKQLRYVERNAKRLLHLVNQLMDYRRAELGVFKLRIQEENVHKIVRENWSFYEKLAQNKKLRYNLISEMEGKTAFIDGQYLELILNNLLSNAFKYTDAGSITVRVYERAGNLMLEVSDTGTGIPAGQQDRIFERFYQVDSEHIGSGIGLSLIQRLVELHHGQIELRSEVNKGSTFIVSLPSTESAYTIQEREGKEAQEAHTTNTQEMYMLDTEREITEFISSGNNKRGSLLIAEDNEDIRAYMNEELSKMFDIRLAGNGEEALQMIKENEPDIVITDMMMPVMDGIKLCSHIKQNISTSHIPVIMLSAKTDSKDELEAFKTGADDFMVKPFSMAVLIAKMQNMLRTQYRLQDKVTKSMEISPEKISFNAMDEQILNKAIHIVEQNIDNAEFSTEEFARAMNMSRSNLHLKLKALTGESALDFIRKIRFKEACRLLKDGRYSVSEISDMVGFNTPSYFATCFKKYMGCLPTEYIRKNN